MTESEYNYRYFNCSCCVDLFIFLLNDDTQKAPGEITVSIVNKNKMILLKYKSKYTHVYLYDLCNFWKRYTPPTPSHIWKLYMPTWMLFSPFLLLLFCVLFTWVLFGFRFSILKKDESETKGIVFHLCMAIFHSISRSVYVYFTFLLPWFTSINAETNPTTWKLQGNSVY